MENVICTLYFFFLFAIHDQPGFGYVVITAEKKIAFEWRSLATLTFSDRTNVVEVISETRLLFFVFLVVRVCVSWRKIPKRDLAPKNTVDESNCGSFLQAVDWKAGTADGPGPKPLTDR